MPTDDDPVWWRMCPPCAAVDHENCRGAEVVCECWVELMWEAEEMSDEKH